MSGGERVGEAFLLLLVLLLPLSALVGRRLPLPQLARMALGWVGVFALLWIVVGQRDRLRDMWDGLTGAQQSSGGTVRIPMDADGHFWADARVNGRALRLLIDSGATTTGLSVEDARAAGVDLDGIRRTRLNTANGQVYAIRSRIDTITIGSVTERDLGVVVAPEFGVGNVLGMNFLSRLGSWRVEGRTLILEPHRQRHARLFYIIHIIG